MEPICAVLECAVDVLGGEKREVEPSARAVRDEQLKKEIMRVWEDPARRVYGARKVRTHLNRAGVEVARCTVERLMRELDLAGARATRKRPRTMVPGVERPGELLERDFTADAPNRRWVAVSRATAYRYIDEGIAVLAAQASDLHEALERARNDGHPYLIMDGTLLPTDRCAQQALSVKGELIDLWYCGKAHEHAGNVQGLSCPAGLPLWVSDVEPGSVHDLTAARAHVRGALYAAAAQGLPTLADGGYEGAGIGGLTPIKNPADGQTLSIGNRTYNRLQRGLRCLGERGFALLKGRWRILQHITASPSRIGDITRAAFVLTHFEHGHLSEIRWDHLTIWSRNWLLPNDESPAHFWLLPNWRHVTIITVHGTTPNR